eukprot:TRINITY_DN6409_c0_g1_i1.p1 TRINITY_DN6409_c0_g1~~TRINITY_DN6409_c0_g1_i1.p1  ORF type:complete len:610 (+),score=134.12 TRINITY_DN6409_c0_g1_i1:172-2001(+)
MAKFTLALSLLSLFFLALTTTPCLSSGVGDRLLTTFLKFDQQPLTVENAEDDGWESFTDCDPNIGIGYTQKKFFSSPGPTKTDPIILYYTSAGQLAGAGLMTFNGPPEELRGTWWKPLEGSDSKYTISVSFRDPALMCSGDTATEPLGDRLIVNQDIPAASLSIPLTSDEATAQGFMAGNCIEKMGIHYSYDLSTMDGTSSFVAANQMPVVPMYNADTGALRNFLISVPSAQLYQPLGPFEGPFTPSLYCLNWCSDSGCEWPGVNLWATLHFMLNDPDANTCDAAPSNCKLKSIGDLFKDGLCDTCVDFWDNLREDVGCNEDSGGICGLWSAVGGDDADCRTMIDSLCAAGCESDPASCAPVACSAAGICPKPCEESRRSMRSMSNFNDCHDSCTTCSGPGEDECTTCCTTLNFESKPVKGECACADGYFKNIRGVCMPITTLSIYVPSLENPKNEKNVYAKIGNECTSADAIMLHRVGNYALSSCDDGRDTFESGSTSEMCCVAFEQFVEVVERLPKKCRNSITLPSSLNIEAKSLLSNLETSLVSLCSKHVSLDLAEEDTFSAFSTETSSEHSKDGGSSSSSSAAIFGVKMTYAVAVVVISIALSMV